MSNKELYSPEGFRVDGRRWNELKSFGCQINTHQNSSDGSSYIEQGNTKVMCVVNGPIEPKSKSSMNTEACTITISLNIASFSSIERRKRTKSDKRIKEMVSILEKTFSEAVMIHLYPRTQVMIMCHVLSQDGGVLSAITNSITLALIDAGVAMYDFVSATSVGLYNNAVCLLDLNNLEESDMSFLTVAVVGQTEKIALLLLEKKIPLDKLESMLAIGISGAGRMKELMDEELKRYGKSLLASKGS